MRKRLFGTLVLFSFLMSLLLCALTVGGLYLYLDAELRAELRAETEALSARLSSLEDPTNALRQSVFLERVTLVDSLGQVLFDSKSDAPAMENHLARPEIAQAFLTGEGFAKRESATLTTQSVYCAKRLPNHTVLRLSRQQRTVFSMLYGALPWLALCTLLCVLFASLAARPVTKALLRPMNAVRLDDPLKSETYDELAPMLRRMDEQNRCIAEQMASLKAQKSELHVILGGMQEGLLALSDKGKILTINDSAREILGVTEDDLSEKTLPEINRSPQLLALLKGKDAHASTDVPCRDRVYHATMSVSPSGGKVLFFQDVTQELGAESLRRQFTANVSHELRTPLTTITGYAELLAGGLTASGDTAAIGGKILLESRRLLTLIEDIMRLSKLDEGILQSQMRRVDLLKIARDCAARRADMAAQRGVTLSVSGEPAFVLGDEGLLCEMLVNLIENAVKYNHKGGRAQVSVTNEQASPVVTVSDTGMGIPKEHQPHVFERFYRVDKSRSKETGGTGLGLSIVKHVAALHHAAIHLESRVDEGTRVTLTFEPYQE